MSRYGRIKESDDLDRYYSPPWPTKILLERLRRLDAWGPEQLIAEPCAGQGHIADVLLDHGHDVLGSDIDPGSPYLTCDATAREALELHREADWVITNPPYSADTGSATDVVRTMLSLEVPMAFLMRLSWLEPCSQRAGLFADTWLAELGDIVPEAPDEIIVLPRVDYGGPKGGDGNPSTSIWCLWLGLAGPTTVRWATKADRERVEGQESLL